MPWNKCQRCICFVLAVVAWSDANPADIESIRRVAESVGIAMSVIGKSYSAHRMVDIYSASGTLMDW